MKYISWLLKAVIFFVLFAFALNNQTPVDLHFFFGTTWQAPMVLVVLTTFVMGLFAGIVVMLPLWLNARRKGQTRPQTLDTRTGSAVDSTPPHGL